MRRRNLPIYVSLSILLFQVHRALALHRDNDDKRRFTNKLLIKLLPTSNDTPESYKDCLGNQLPYIISDLNACGDSAGVSSSSKSSGTCNVTFSKSPTGNEKARNEALKILVNYAKESAAYHGKYWLNVFTIIVKCLPLFYFIILCLFTRHFSTRYTNNPRLLDGSSVRGQREYVFRRPGFHLYDGSVKPARLVGLEQKFILWRDDVESSNDWELSQRFIQSGFSPVPGANFHVAANIPIPELDEDEMTEAQALKRRIKKYGVMTRDQFRYNVEQIHARRLVLTAAKEYQRRVIERGDEPLFGHNTEAKEAMEIALKWSREQRIANQLRIEAERRERDKTIDIQWEKSNKTFRDHRQRMREHQEKVDTERKARVSMGLPAIGPEQLDFL